MKKFLIILLTILLIIINVAFAETTDSTEETALTETTNTVEAGTTDNAADAIEKNSPSEEVKEIILKCLTEDEKVTLKEVRKLLE
ncbi:MAG TPA: hypothetical protein DCS12_00770 [Clostridiales bacterium]|jgi:uncharacterized protein (UPF0333 family)|nr:hypothetical protein [Clostridiales bacterium]